MARGHSAWSIRGAAVAGVAFRGDKWLASWNQKLLLSSSTQAEAFALLLATKVATVKNWKKIILLSDAQLVVHSVEGKIGPPWEIKNLIFDLTKLKTVFDSYNVYWISRSVNSLAHSLCKAGFNNSNNDLYFWGLSIDPG